MSKRKIYEVRVQELDKAGKIYIPKRFLKYLGVQESSVLIVFDDGKLMIERNIDEEE